MSDPKYYRPGIDHALGKLVEECGEVLAAVGKTYRWGLDSYDPTLDTPVEERETNGEWIGRELADLIDAALNLQQELITAGYAPG